MMQVEVENVSSMLKIRAESDNKEWRTHLELTKELLFKASRYASLTPGCC